MVKIVNNVVNFLAYWNTEYYLSNKNLKKKSPEIASHFSESRKYTSLSVETK